MKLPALQDAEDEEAEERPRQRNRFIDDIAAVDEDEEEEEDDVRALPCPACVFCLKWEHSSHAQVSASVAHTPAEPWCRARYVKEG